MCGTCPPGTKIRPHRLSEHGTIYTCTVVHVRSALGHRPPYAYGYVDLPADGTRIFAPLDGDPDTPWAPGMAVSLVFGEVVASAMPGVLGYAFRQDGR